MLAFSAPTISRGTGGLVRCGALIVGELGAWEIVLSPTTGQPTLKGGGVFRRFWVAQPPSSVTVRLTPAAPAPTLRKPRPKAPPPFVLTGRIARLTPTAITISHGETDRPL